MDIEDNNNTNAKIVKILFELASQQRLEILLKVAEKNTKLSSISKEFELPMPEVHRNIIRLSEAQLIKKDSEGMFYLSTLGKAIIKQIPSLRFLLEYADYFNRHSFGDLHIKFIQSIGALENCKFVDGITNVIDIWEKIIRNTNEYFYAIVPQFGGSVTELAYSNFVQKNIKLKAIVPKNAIVSKRFYELEKNMQLKV